MSIKLKYTVALFVITSLIVAVLSVYLVRKQVASLVEERRESFRTLSTSLSASFSSTLFTLHKFPGDKIIISQQLSEIFEARIPGLAGIVVLDKTGVPVHEQFTMKTLAKAWQDREEIASPERFPDETGVYALQEMEVGDEDIQALYSTIGFQAQDEEFQAGSMAVFFTLDDAYRAGQQAALTSSIIVALVMLCSIVFIYFVSLFLTRRIYTIVESVQALRMGRFVQMEPRGNDEVGLLMRETNSMIDTVRERELLSRYVSDSTLEHVSRSRSSEEVDFRGEHRDLAILFTDIRGFTAYTESNEPREVVATLNRMLDLQVAVIRHHGGDIDKFVADEVMAVFNGPNKVANAMDAAMEIRRRIEEEGFPLRLGMGLNIGRVVWGNIGSADRVDATCIGDAVNTAARLCDMAGPGEILCTAEIAELYEEASMDADVLTLKGKSEPIRVFRA